MWAVAGMDKRASVLSKVGEIAVSLQKKDIGVSLRLLGLSGFVLKELPGTGASARSAEKVFQLLESISKLNAATAVSLKGLVDVFELRMQGETGFWRIWQNLKVCTSVGELEAELGLIGSVLSQWRAMIEGMQGRVEVRVSCMVDGLEVGGRKLEVDADEGGRQEFLGAWAALGESVYEKVAQRNKLEAMLGELSAQEKKALLVLLSAD